MFGKASCPYLRGCLASPLSQGLLSQGVEFHRSLPGDRFETQQLTPYRTTKAVQAPPGGHGVLEHDPVQPVLVGRGYGAGNADGRALPQRGEGGQNGGIGGHEGRHPEETSQTRV